MNQFKCVIKNIIISFSILIITFVLSLCIQGVLETKSLISPLFILACFLISLSTNGYLYGIIGALLSVVAVNFAFTFPYYSIDFSMMENIISAFIFIFVACMTSALTVKVKKNERARADADKEKLRADLLRSVSHDLRTPLTTIYGASSTIIDNYQMLSDEKKKDILNGIQSDSKWLIRMVENLLSITRLDNNKVKLSKFPIVLEELVDSTLNKLKKNYPDQKVELNFPDDFVVISGDALLLEQVLMNLLENAVHHAIGMTELKLNIFVIDKKVIFEIIDNGCGITKERLKNIFTGYYKQEKLVQENQKKCMGIGLSVCAAIIKAHDGEITAENRKDGGMIFRFALDVEENIEENINE